MQNLLNSKHGMYKYCGIECFEGIKLEPRLLQPCIIIVILIITLFVSCIISVIIIIVILIITLIVSCIISVSPRRRGRERERRIFESKFRDHCAKKLDDALRKPTSFV